MGHIIIETRIRAPVELCFDLARDVSVHAKSAAFSSERVVGPGRTQGLLELGDIISFEGRHFGFTQRFVARITALDRPDRFVDEMVTEGQGLSLPRRGHGTQLYNLRLYQPGDDSRAIHWMTTARTSTLTVRETEAEDQRRITIALSTLAPVERNTLFEHSVTLVASLLWHLSQRSYPLRLIVHEADSGLGCGADHLLAMLRLLALCERRAPDTAGPTVSNPVLTLGHDAERGYTVLVLPWSDPEAPAPMSADRVLSAAHIEGLTHGF